MIHANLLETKVTSLPTWQCPACSSSALICQDEAVHHGDESGMGWMSREGLLEPWDHRGPFMGRMTCASDACGQDVFVTGLHHKEEQDGFKFITWLEIHDIFPAIRIIEIPDEAPDVITDALQRSFSLYWSDPRSAAATIRLAIEFCARHILGIDPDEHNAPPAGKLIEQLREQGSHPELINAFKAIKDLGNDGVHGRSVDRRHLITAFALIEMDLATIFAADRRQELVGRFPSGPSN